MHDLQDGPLRESHGQVPKQRYEKPELIVYGDIAALTHNVGKNGSPDGGMQTGKMSTMP
jgi:hypothetical protein